MTTKSFILDVPSALGPYMLSGWVLTDRSCTNNGCTIPLLRSPSGQDPVVHFCVGCDQKPNAPPQPSTTSTSEAPQPDTSTSTLTSSGSLLTRASTPATELSVASDDFPPFVESDESRRRREQTDRASTEIGQRLLRGWTMLGDECPQQTCYFVPLVRPPKTAENPDPKKECVLCGNIYKTEKDWVGRETLILVNSSTPLHETTSTTKANTSMHSASFSAQSHSRQRSTLPVISSDVGSFQNQPNLDSITVTKTPASSIVGTLDASAKALELSLQTLTTRLTSLSSTFVDTTSIATTADAISKITQALSQVKQLQWSEMQALSIP